MPRLYAGFFVTLGLRLVLPLCVFDKPRGCLGKTKLLLELPKIGTFGVAQLDFPTSITIVEVVL